MDKNDFLVSIFWKNYLSIEAIKDHLRAQQDTPLPLVLNPDQQEKYLNRFFELYFPETSQNEIQELHNRLLKLE